jgi:hypothetical protein
MNAQMHVSGFYLHEPKAKEDFNVVEFSSVEALEKSLIHRARCIMGFRGIRSWETEHINLNALQHAVRMVAQEYRGCFSVVEHIVAEYARHVADETIYWYADAHYRLSMEH